MRVKLVVIKMKIMFLSTKGILNTPWTFLKRSSSLCIGCRCRPPCVEIITVCPKIISKIFTCRDCSNHYTPEWGSPETWDCTRRGKLRKLNSRPWKKWIIQMEKCIVLIISTTVFVSSGWLCSGLWSMIFGSNDSDDSYDEDVTWGIQDADIEPDVVCFRKALSWSLTLCFWCLGHPLWLYFIFPSSPLQWPPGMQTPSTSFRNLRVIYHRKRTFWGQKISIMIGAFIVLKFLITSHKMSTYHAWIAIFIS